MTLVAAADQHCARMSGRQQPLRFGNFSAKRRMRPAKRTVFDWIRRMPSFSICGGEGFLFRRIVSSLSRQTGNAI
jgi:hypothetical protein